METSQKRKKIALYVLQFVLFTIGWVVAGMLSYPDETNGQYIIIFGWILCILSAYWALKTTLEKR